MTPWNSGSRWVRWDPHLHTPQTLLNDQFNGDWDGYFAAIGAADPPAEVLGITDYYSLRGYREFLARRSAGGLNPAIVAFPNVEMRLTVETRKGHGINIHLLVSPDDPDHVTAIEQRVSRLTFRYGGTNYPCSEDGLRALGKAYSGKKLDDEAALRAGANQFKVDLGRLREVFDQDEWMRTNVLIAIAGGSDGLGGLSKDAGFAALREELGRLASIVFSGQPGDRAFWLGQHPDFSSSGLKPRPCLHGSDAHEIAEVLQPKLDRRCWIRGDTSFESLRQVLVEPERRVYIGEYPPAGPPASASAELLRVENAPWLRSAEVEFNPGLVTIIGAKGSGKTALADLLALAAGSRERNPGPASFIDKAGGLLKGLETELRWGSGETQSEELDNGGLDPSEERVQYLSQQFVERLSSPTDLSEPLITEIERVVFSAIPEESRLETASFSALREAVLTESQASKDFEEDAIRKLTDRVAHEQQVQRSIPSLESKAKGATDRRAGIEQAIVKLPLKATKAKVDAHQEAADALRALKDAVAAAEKRARQLREVRSEVARQLRTSESALLALRTKYEGLLETEDWNRLQLRTADEAMTRVASLIEEADNRATDLRRDGLPGNTKQSKRTGGLEALSRRSEDTAKELGLDEANVQRRRNLEQQLTKARTDEATAHAALNAATGSPDRIRTAQSERLDSYERVFEALAEEEQSLLELYAPLRSQIQDDAKLAKLTFVVQRSVDIADWVLRGERLVDLRRSPFGQDGLLKAVSETLREPWQGGSPADVRRAMQDFLTDRAANAIRCLASGYSPADFGQWVLSTDHIRVRYGILYDGVEISRLSPGTRGVVLLTLYLALDRWDIRPLVIDQPEENLDPSSVNDDLVPFFRDAANRRQIVMVTHNANLVVNTDSDQVIVAYSERKKPNALPTVTYSSGGLENPAIRAEICRLLEGGEDAFRRRGLRYGIAG